ncbi:MAG: hypothetical protein DI586_05330 [Micavibrio aeruginosavorus]|uniref:Prepilin type IV endopeptidase peptidase domain-containing protein n=1 Tax=Micavibrio aeruginosavorus TaxID=349221 RepID=A0A2W5FNG4_9BACT|nr:MAG: hypothetical protein DI586_05330 [Micavibrio aeruginosavorus]
MIGFIFFFFGIIAAIGMSGLAAWTDFKGYRIPNIISVIIAASFVTAFGITFLTGQNEIIFFSWQSHLGSFFLVLIITMAMFAFKALGAGDSKMASAIALWLGWGGLVPFLFYMALTGGVLALVSIILKKYKPFKLPLPGILRGSWLENAQIGVNKVPYGIAIAVGALIAFVFNGYFSFEKWSEMMNL